MQPALAAACVTACGATAVTTPVVLAAMRRLAAIDEVTARSSHRAPTVRGGGVAVVLGLFVGVLTAVLVAKHDGPNLLPFTAAATLFGLIGLAEDVGGVTAMRRLALHVAAAFVITAMTVLAAVLGDPTPGLAAVLAVTVCAPLWITGFVNVFNFMDGINGISGMSAALAGGTLAALGALRDAPAVSAGGILVAATALGFLPYNFPRARIFLGDVGSYTLGAVIAVLTTQAVLVGVPLEAALAPSALYLADTSVTLLRRVRAGEPWHTAHRSHAYQRLTIAGWTHPQVTGLVAGVSTIVVALSLASFGPWPGRLTADLAAAVVLAGYLRLPDRVTLATVTAATTPSSATAPPTATPSAATPSPTLPTQRVAPSASPSPAAGATAGVSGDTSGGTSGSPAASTPAASTPAGRTSAGRTSGRDAS
ncbi:MraY family glycosyltransferase [Candidatus Frankia nodulisporulans]|uniref:MraY family glycosyltransferase n=1 Tax=Candidatus Frankia nodulisporulans TaxID=2060052 RepID=UPI001CDB8215|nr:glycosyltransferase family 4 protein [Candidatus Frankia nodulisporulans]